MDSKSSASPRTLAAIHEQKGIILGVKHWRSIPEYVAEMGTLNHQERMLRRSQPADESPKPKPQPPVPHRIESGDHVRHAERGDGVVIRLQVSFKLHQVLCLVEYANGDKLWTMESDLEYIPEGAQP